MDVRGDMYTYQDFLKCEKNEDSRTAFCLDAIKEHRGTQMYKMAVEADEYDAKRNTTITNYQKFLYNLKGQAVPDRFTPSYKLTSGFFNSFVTQQNQYLLGNGMSLSTGSKSKNAAKKEKEKLGKRFDTILQLAGRSALLHGVSFGFWNYNHLEVFKFTEFVPLRDEENGALMAGIRFWQIAPEKPLRFNLYELDGYTEYIQRVGKKPEILKKKRAYIIHTTIDGIGNEIRDGENYPTFPIIPLWGNPQHQSELVGFQADIDCYDLIKSGFANDLDDVSSIYWILHNSGGMTDMDLTKFVERMKTIKAVSIDTDSGQGAEAHTLEVPHEARMSYLKKLEEDMYRDFQIVNVSSISGGQKTATEIDAAYTPMDAKVDQYEYCILNFLDLLFALVGVEGSATFKRSRVVNQTEETEMVISAAQFLDEEAVLAHLPWLTPEEAEDILKRLDDKNAQRALQQPQIEDSDDTEDEDEEEVTDNE